MKGCLSGLATGVGSMRMLMRFDQNETLPEGPLASYQNDEPGLGLGGARG